MTEDQENRSLHGCFSAAAFIRIFCLTMRSYFVSMALSVNRAEHRCRRTVNAYVTRTTTVEVRYKHSFDSQKAIIVALLFYVHGKHLRSCRDGQLT